MVNDVDDEPKAQEIVKQILFEEAKQNHQRLEAKHRQMDINLEEVSLLQNPEVDIFPKMDPITSLTTEKTRETTGKLRKVEDFKDKKNFALRLIGKSDVMFFMTMVFAI